MIRKIHYQTGNNGLGNVSASGVGYLLSFALTQKKLLSGATSRIQIKKQIKI
jgi:hypothetical protein